MFAPERSGRETKSAVSLVDLVFGALQPTISGEVSAFYHFVAAVDQPSRRSWQS